MSILPKLVNALCALLIVFCSAASAQSNSYQLGPEDVLLLNVVEWDDASGTYLTIGWVSGEYKVSVDGSISLPVVGNVVAEGLTQQEVENQVAEALMSSAGLFQLPIVSSQIASYRPIYISGDVNGPGAYEWRPRLTVSKAMALAGGVVRTRVDALDETGGFREISLLRSVQVELVRFVARVARLEAELADQAEINFPETLFHPDGSDPIERIQEEERAILAIRRESLRRATESNEDLIALHQTELAALQSKLEGQQAQLELTRQQVEDIQALVERGTVTANRLVTVQQTLTDLSAEELDLNTAIFRARQRISETERDLLQFTDNRRSDVMNQLQDARQRIELASKREEMLAGLAMMSGVEPVDTSFVVDMQVRREIDGKVDILSVGPDDLILPGDVLEVAIAIVMTDG